MGEHVNDAEKGASKARMPNFTISLSPAMRCHKWMPKGGERAEMDASGEATLKGSICIVQP